MTTIEGQYDFPMYKPIQFCNEDPSMTTIEGQYNFPMYKPIQFCNEDPSMTTIEGDDQSIDKQAWVVAKDRSLKLVATQVVCDKPFVL